MYARRILFTLLLATLTTAIFTPLNAQQLNAFPSTESLGNSPTIQWIVFGTLLVLSPLYVCYIKTEPKGLALNKIFPCFSSLLSFTVWVFALGGPFMATWPKWYQPFYGSIALILATLILPVLERAFYDSTPPAQQ